MALKAKAANPKSARHGVIPSSLTSYLSASSAVFSGLPLKQQAAIAVYMFSHDSKRYQHSEIEDAQCLFWEDLHRVFRGTWHQVNAALGHWFEPVGKYGPGKARPWKLSDAAYSLLEGWAFTDYVLCKLIDFEGRPVRKPRTAISQMTADGKSKSRFRGLPVQAYVPIDGDNLFKLIKACHAWQQGKPVPDGFQWAYNEWNGREAADGRRKAAPRAREVLLTASRMLHIAAASAARDFAVPTTYAEAESGRLYPDGLSLASCVKEVKRAALVGCWEYDGANMHWQLLYQLAKRAAAARGDSIDLPEIEKYLQTKPFYRKRIADKAGLITSYGKTQGIAKAKEVLIALIYGAALKPKGKDDDNKGRIHEIVGDQHIDALRKEVTPLWSDLLKARAIVLEYYRAKSRKVHRSAKLVNDAGRTFSPAPKTTNLKAKELAHILQGMESEILRACIEYAGDSVVLLQHDGFTTSTRLDINGLQEAIREHTGLMIEMEETQL